MRIHSLQHVSYGHLTTIAQWAKHKKLSLSTTLLYQDFELPKFDDFDLLIILGGPMSIFDEGRYPWLKEEKKFIIKVIEKGKTLLGICLGAQLLADAMGARVYKSQYTEIGWHPVSLTEEAKNSRVFGRLPRIFTPFLWHEYSFEIPKGCRRVAESESCVNQAFEYRDKIIGIQFHIEPPIIKSAISYCGAQMKKGKYVQSPEEMLNGKANAEKLDSVMTLLMDGIEGICRPGGAI